MPGTPGNRIAIDKHQRTITIAANTQLIVHGTHRSTISTKGFISKTIKLAKCFCRVSGSAFLDLFRSQHHCRCRHIHIFFRCACRSYDSIIHLVHIHCTCTIIPSWCTIFSSQSQRRMCALSQNNTCCQPSLFLHLNNLPPCCNNTAHKIIYYGLKTTLLLIMHVTGSS